MMTLCPISLIPLQMMTYVVSKNQIPNKSGEVPQHIANPNIIPINKEEFAGVNYDNHKTGYHTYSQEMRFYLS